MRSRVPLILTALIAMTANAAGASGTAAIGSVVVDSGDELVAISADAAWSNPDGCAASNLIVFPFSNPHYKDLLATVLMAHASGKPVNFWVDGCIWTPWGVSPRAVTVTVD